MPAWPAFSPSSTHQLVYNHQNPAHVTSTRPTTGHNSLAPTPCNMIYTQDHAHHENVLLSTWACQTTHEKKKA